MRRLMRSAAQMAFRARKVAWLTARSASCWACSARWRAVCASSVASSAACCAARATDSRSARPAPALEPGASASLAAASLSRIKRAIFARKSASLACLRAKASPIHAAEKPTSAPNSSQRPAAPQHRPAFRDDLPALPVPLRPGLRGHHQPKPEAQPGQERGGDGPQDFLVHGHSIALQLNFRT